MMALPTRTWQKLARRLSRGDNPLCPLVFVLSSMWVSADNAAVRQAQQSWHAVPAVLLRAAPGPEFSDNGTNTWEAWTLARWTVDGRQQVGEIPAAAKSPAGSTQTVWLDPAGHVRVPPQTPGQARDESAAAALLAMAGLALLLGIAARLVHWVLDRRRLAGWEIGWLSVGPRWSHQL
jgi:uncharacterized membrane protein YphA (DoxX/SURF4 family)